MIHTFQCGNEHSVPNLQPDFVVQNRHSGGCQYSQGDLVQVPFKKCVHGCRLNFSDWLLPLMFVFLDTLLPRFFDGSEGVAAFGVGFARSLLSCRKLHWSPFEHCLLSSTGNKYLFLFQRHLIPCDSQPLPLSQFSHFGRRNFHF